MAGSNDLIWLHGKANVPGNPEKICPGRHVRQNEWQPEWNDMYLPPNGEGDATITSPTMTHECIFNHPVSHAGNKQEHWKKLQDAKTRLGGTTMQIGTLSKDVFKRRTSTGSEAFSLSICFDANKLVLLSFFSLLKTIYPRVSTKPLPNDAKSPLPADVRRSKTLLLKLPNKRTCPLYKPRSCRSDR